MKTIAVLLLVSFLFSSCSKRDYSNTEKQEVLSQEISGQETRIPDASYVFDITSFKYIDEFPRTITGIKAMYLDESFEEKVLEITGKFDGPAGKYMYLLRTPDIRFDFFGDTAEEAILCSVDIFNSNYQCESMQVIGMPAEELERVSGLKLNLDKNIAIYNELHNGLIITTKGGFVQSYSIYAPS